MSGGSFNVMQYLFQKAYFRSRFKERNPQCDDCEEVNSLIFAEHYYKIMIRDICPNCDKYKRGDTDAEEAGGAEG